MPRPPATARISECQPGPITTPTALSFPSAPFGFCGQRLTRRKDPALGLATMRAFNDWMIEDWAGPYPDRIIPLGLTLLTDPELGAAEIRRNAARGFRAVTLPEQPHRIGMPSIFSGWWDPIIAACEALVAPWE